MKRDDMNADHQHHEHPAISYGKFVGVWLALLMLTALTVAASGLQLHVVGVVTAACVATLKTLLVLYIFMHLMYEERIFKIALAVGVATLAVFITLTFADFPFR